MSDSAKKKEGFFVKEIVLKDHSGVHCTFRLGRKLGSGGYGDIFSGACAERTDEVAVKIGTAGGKSMLVKEVEIYERFRERYEGIPELVAHGTGDSPDGEYYAMVMQMLGPSLQDLLVEYYFSPEAVSIIAIQVLRHLEYIHSKAYIHGDIKPSNFLIGAGVPDGAPGPQNRSKVFIIDFGLSKPYRANNGKHLPFTLKNGFHGTPRYASLHTHGGESPSRRDDLESLGYVLIYLLKGKLPWQNPPPGVKRESKKAKRKRITDMKRNLPLKDLCSDLPHEYVEYLERTRTMRYNQDPDYSGLRALFAQVLRRARIEETADWRGALLRRPPKNKKSPEPTSPARPTVPVYPPSPAPPSSMSTLSSIQSIRSKESSQLFARAAPSESVIAAPILPFTYTPAPFRSLEPPPMASIPKRSPAIPDSNRRSTKKAAPAKSPAAKPVEIIIIDEDSDGPYNNLSQVKEKLEEIEGRNKDKDDPKRKQHSGQNLLNAAHKSKLVRTDPYMFQT
jgi:serine/threonine protein kinase